MVKIPVKIVEVTSPSGVTKKGVMLDVIDYLDLPGDAQKQVKKFEKIYFKTVEKAQKIFPKKKKDRKASHFWQMGKLLFDFNNSIKNDFEITNYNPAIIRDFGLYERSVVGHTLQFGEYFKKKDIDDDVSMSHYMEIIWKANMLKELGLFEKEKRRLLKMKKDGTLPPHKEYREELNSLTKYRDKQKIKAK